MFRNPLGNVVAQGLDGASEWLAKNESEGVQVEPDGPEHDDGVRIAVPVRMRTADGTELLPAGIFEIRGDKIARFEVTGDAMRSPWVCVIAIRELHPGS